MKRALLLGLVLLVGGCHGNWVEMPGDYLSEVTALIKIKLYEKMVEAERTILEHRLSWENEEQNAERWKTHIEELAENVRLHLKQLEEAKDDIMTHTKHQCIHIIQQQKEKCLNCVSDRCNTYVEGSCDFESEANSMLEDIIEYLMQLFNVKSEKLDDEQTQQMIERGTRDLHDSTEKLLYQLGVAKKALEDTTGSKVNLTSLKRDMDEVRETSKEYITQIGSKIGHSESVIDGLLSKDEEIKKALKIKKAVSSDSASKSSGAAKRENKSIFATVWDETKNVVGETVCLISFGYWCPGQDKGQTKTEQPNSEDEKIMELKDLINEMNVVPRCDQIQSNVSYCLYFIPRCSGDCFNISVNTICPQWFQEWKGYKTAWTVTRTNLQHVYEDLRSAENEMIKVIHTHNEAVSYVLRNFGWLVTYANSSEPLEKLKITGVKFDPTSFDPDVVNRFRNSTLRVQLAGEAEEEIRLDENVDPYDATDFANTAMKFIEKFEQQKHLQTNKFKDLIKKFTKKGAK